jgi:hypothetical protein
MKKRWMSQIGMLFCLIVTLTLMGCGNYEEVGFGEVLNVSKGAAWKSKGGGMDYEPKYPGTNFISELTVDYRVIRVCTTPQIIPVRDLPVMMSNMRNAEVKFTPELHFMVNARKSAYVTENFRDYAKELKSIFRESAWRILSTLDMGLDVEVYSDDEDKPKKVIPKDQSFDSREAVATRILDEFIVTFAKKHPEYIDCFIFLGVVQGNVDFRGKVLTALEESVTKQYEAEVLIVKGEAQVLEGRLKTAESDADLAAAEKEAGVLDDKVISYLGDGILKKIFSNPFLKTVAIIPIADDGTVAWFKADHKKK